MTAPPLDPQLAEMLRCIAQARVPLDELIDRYIEQTLALAQGNLARAAARLGWDRRTLYRHGFRGRGLAWRRGAP